MTEKTAVSDYWLKLYLEILDDPKMGTLSDHLWRRTVELMLAAKRIGKDGYLPDAQQIAWMLRLSDVDQLQSDLEAIAATGIIQPVGEGWLIVNFASRQGPSTSTERKRQQRDRKRANQYIPVGFPPDGSPDFSAGGRSGNAPVPGGVPTPAGPGATGSAPVHDPEREVAAAARKMTQITPEERAWLNTVIDAFGEKFANPTQIRTAIKIRAQFGEQLGTEAITYYANKGRPLGEGLARALRALPKWGTFQDRPPAPHSPASTSQPSAAQLAAELKDQQ